MRTPIKSFDPSFDAKMFRTERNVEIIAEVKTKSPFGYRSNHSWEKLFETADEIGDMLSIHVEVRWGGSLPLLRRARGLTKKPIVAKGIHATDDDVQRSLDMGADWVLVVGRIPEIHCDRCLIEPLSLEQLRTIPPQYRIVWNSRDLETGGLKTETFNEARQIVSGWLCQASNVQSPEDIELRANAVLVGTHLRYFAARLKHGNQARLRSA